MELKVNVHKRKININTLNLRRDSRRPTDDIFNRIFLNENVDLLIQTSLRFIPSVQSTIGQH